MRRVRLLSRMHIGLLLELFIGEIMEAKDWTSVAALILSILSLIITQLEKLRTRRETVIKSLQGEKETVAYIAYQISRGKWPSNPSDEEAIDQVITSLCFAWVFESSNRARALVLAALKKMNDESAKAKQIEDVLQSIQKQFIDYARLVSDQRLSGKEEKEDWERIQRGQKRLKQLVLELGAKLDEGMGTELLGSTDAA